MNTLKLSRPFQPRTFSPIAFMQLHHTMRWQRGFSNGLARLDIDNMFAA